MYRVVSFETGFCTRHTIYLSGTCRTPFGTTLRHCFPYECNIDLSTHSACYFPGPGLHQTRLGMWPFVLVCLPLLSLTLFTIWSRDGFRSCIISCSNVEALTLLSVIPNEPSESSPQAPAPSSDLPSGQVSHLRELSAGPTVFTASLTPCLAFPSGGPRMEERTSQSLATVGASAPSVRLHWHTSQFVSLLTPVYRPCQRR